MTNGFENSDSNSEESSFWTRLESIFMPHFKEQCDKFFKTVTDKSRFVHYTSADAALSIIQNKRIWMRNTVCMSDFQEVQYGYDILHNYFYDPTKGKAFFDALEQCVPGIVLEAIKLFDQWWNIIKSQTFITSVSEHDDSEDIHGRLSMWRAFGGHKTRVALVFNLPVFSEGSQALNLMFNPVAYLTKDEVHGVMNQVKENIEANSDFLSNVERQSIVNQIFYMLRASVVCLKHEGFKEEREWRAIFTPNLLGATPLMEPPSTQVLEGIPQLVYEIPLDESVSPILADLEFSRLFDRLIIGPTPYPLPIYQAFETALKNAGVANPIIQVSGIPIRS